MLSILICLTVRRLCEIYKNMDFLSWFQLSIVCLLGAMSPGPSLSIIVHNTVSGGYLQGIMTSIGHGLGIAIYALGAVSGLTIILENKPELFFIANILGAIFLGFLGIKLIKKSLTKRKNKPQPLNSRQIGGFFEGLTIALINPKVAAFFLALFSQYLKLDAALLEKTVMVATAGMIDALWYMFVTISLNQTAISWLHEYSGLFDRTMGSVLLIFAVSLLWY